jgi:hypothetical protein
MRLYQRAELDAAMAELKAAEDGKANTEDDIVQILIYKGLIFAETGQQAQMQDSFKRALAMRPWADTPHDTSPRLTKIFHDARREVWGSPGLQKPPVKKPSAKPAEPAREAKPAEQKPEPPPAESPKVETPAAPPAEAPAAAPAEEPKAEAPKPEEPKPEAPAPDPSADAPPDVPPTEAPKE